MDAATQERAVESIARQFSGGEHKNAGARASQLVYGTAKKPNEKLLQAIVDKVPGIDRYISAPETPVTTVSDQGGDPLSKQPENDPDKLYQSNMSSEQAVDEQNEIDAAFAAGRKRTEGSDSDAADDVGDTRLNPAGSDEEVAAKPGRKPKAKD